MDSIGKLATDLLSRVQSSQEKATSEESESTTTMSPEAAARLEEIRKADCEAWIQKAREKAMAAIGERPFTYDPERVQKRRNLGMSQGAIIAGLPGRGKSMGMAWVIDKTLKDVAPTYAPRGEFPFVFISSSALWDMFYNGTAPDPLTPWVFIDDWGTEYRQQFAATRADEWFRERESRLNLHTWMTTNLDRQAFIEQPGLERVVSRMQSMMDWIEFAGPDRRPGWLTNAK